MDTEAFTRWALDDARTLEERYTTELLVERVEQWWHNKNQTGYFTPWKVTDERNRQRFLNPAYQPEYSETSVRRAAEMLPTITRWNLAATYLERPVRDMAVLRFLPALETLAVDCHVPDLSLLAELPGLRTLNFHSPVCEDYRPLARCTQLRSLWLTFGVHWPAVEGLEKLQQLEDLTLGGNLLVLPGGTVFPRVRRGGLHCAPLHTRNVRDLPQFPACEFLTLSGVERLDGIEALPHLRNLTLSGPVRDLAPLAELRALTWLSYVGALPLDVAPLARAPRLLCASFQTQHTFGIDKAPPRDYAPLAASPTLRELHVLGCPPVELEVAALNTALPPWDDVLLAPQPRPVPPLRVIVAPQKMHPQRMEPHRGPDEPELEDTGIRGCEGFWVARFATGWVSERVGHADWGHVDASGSYRTLTARVECYEVLERFPEIVEALREVLARLRYEYIGRLYISLRVPPPEPTAAQAQLLKQFQNEQDEANFEQRQRDERERLEQLYLYQLKQQQGEPVDPAEFAPAPLEPRPPAPWEVESEDDEDDEEGSGNFAVKKKPDPPPDFWDDEHPLAGNYRLGANFNLGEFWLDHYHAALGLHLLRRAADEEFPPEEKSSA